MDGIFGDKLSNLAGEQVEYGTRLFPALTVDFCRGLPLWIDD